ncbi:MAG: hypothetical protein ACOX5M_09175 [Bacillota bacterium]|jgi:hypothetical protein
MADQVKERMVLEGVPKVGFYDGSDIAPEDIPFPSCLASALRFIGEDYPWTTFVENGKTWRRNDAYIELLAASGMAFSLRWKEGWYQDNADMMFVANPEEVIRRAFAHAGYAFRAVEKKEGLAEEAQLFDEIRASLNEGKPVLGFGVVGPPECGLITGYDEGGRILIGWSFFQGMPPFNRGLDFEPDGQYRKRDWLRDTWSLIVIGEKTGRADLSARNREALRWAVSVARMPEVFGRPTGLNAYDAWAKQVQSDACFMTDDERVLQSRHEVHNSAVGIVAECRWAASEFLKIVAETEVSMAPELLAAAECYRKEHDLMWQVWGAVGGNGNPKAFEAFARPEVRHGLAPIILQARDFDAKAADLIERALSR